MTLQELMARLAEDIKNFIEDGEIETASGLAYDLHRLGEERPCYINTWLEHYSMVDEVEYVLTK